MFVSKSRLPAVPVMMASAQTKNAAQSQGQPKAPAPAPGQPQPKAALAAAKNVSQQPVKNGKGPAAAPAPAPAQVSKLARLTSFGLSELPISFDVLRKYLCKVYGLMIVTIIFALVGLNFIDLELQNGWVALLGSIVSMLWMIYDDSTPRRILALYLFGFWQGVTLSLLAYVVNNIDPTIITMAFCMTLCIFVSLCVSAFIFYKPSAYVVVGNFLSVTSALLFALFFFPEYTWVVSMETSLTVLFFTFSVVYTNWSIVKGLEDGSNDMVREALYFTVAFLELFSTILSFAAVRKLIEQSRESRRRRI